MYRMYFINSTNEYESTVIPYRRRSENIKNTDNKKTTNIIVEDRSTKRENGKYKKVTAEQRSREQQSRG